MRPRFLASALLALACLWPVALPPAAAQTPAAIAHLATPPPAAPAAASAAPLTPAEAQAVLDVLNDPVKRAAFAARIELFNKAIKAASPPPAASVPLAPGSVGAQVVAGVAQSATWLSSLTLQLAALDRLAGNLPVVWHFLLRTASDPDLRAQAIQASGGLALFLLGAILIEWTARRLLRRPIASLAARAEAACGSADAPATQPEPAPEDTTATPRFEHLLHALRRLLYVLPRIALDLLPVAVFAGLSTLLANIASPETQDALALAIQTYITARLVLVGVNAIFSPTAPALRLVQLRTPAARYLRAWARRLVLLGATASLTLGLGEQYDMPEPAREALIKAFSLVGHIMVFIMVVQLRRPVANRLRQGAVSNQTMGRVRDALAAYWHWPALFLIAASWVVWAARLRHGLERAGTLGLWSAAILTAYRFAATLSLGGLERWLAPRGTRAKPAHPAYGAHRYLGLAKRLTLTALRTLTVLALLQLWGFAPLAWFQSGKLGGQLASAGGIILLTGLLCLALWEGLNLSLERQLDQAASTGQALRAARLRTLLPILRTSLRLTLLAGFTLTTLSEIGVNIAPLLAGAGILGVAIGFGSQKLVQDFITGIFLLLENAMQVGDWVNVAGFSGTVEALSIRTLKLRGADGVLHVIPFSAVTTVSNSHRGIGIASISVTLDAGTDTDQIAAMLAEIAHDMLAEQRFADTMHGGFQLFGVDRLEAGTATITGQISCTDTGRASVQREFNRRLNIRLRQKGLRTMSPVQTSLTLAAPAPGTPG